MHYFVQHTIESIDHFWEAQKKWEKAMPENVSLLQFIVSKDHKYAVSIWQTEDLDELKKIFKKLHKGACVDHFIEMDYEHCENKLWQRTG